MVERPEIVENQNKENKENKCTERRKKGSLNHTLFDPCRSCLNIFGFLWLTCLNDAYWVNSKKKFLKKFHSFKLSQTNPN
jgi:hypothetical protein